jgi:hypothetical protein
MDMILFAIVFQNPLLAVPFGWGGEGLFVTWNPDIVAFSLGEYLNDSSKEAFLSLYCRSQSNYQHLRPK